VNGTQIFLCHTTTALGRRALKSQNRIRLSKNLLFSRHVIIQMSSKGNDNPKSSCQIRGMLKQPQDICREIVEIARRLYGRNCLAAADGNISVRVSDDEIWMTPSGVAKAFMKAEEMACLTLQGEVRFGNPSGERQMHLEIYRAAPKAKAIVHAHPPTAIAWTLAKPELRELPSDALPEVLLATGRVPIVAYARPGTAKMGTSLRAFLPEHKALLLSRHGAVCWGDDLQEAWRGIERIEHAAQILLSAELLGGPKPVPLPEMDELRKLRETLGGRLL
jgi:L-fuculose-phosphate aldolase